MFYKGKNNYFKDRYSNIFLYYAVKNVNKEIIKLFLSKERIKIKSKKLDYICFNRSEILSLLETLNLNIKVKSKY